MSTSGLDGDAAQRILEERARRLARPPATVSTPHQALDLLVFRRADAVYAVDAVRVVEVLRRTRPTPLPGTRPFLPGVIHHRGRIVAVLDAHALIASGVAPAQEGQMVVVAAGPARLALVADEIQGVRTISVDEMTTAGGLAARAPAVWVRGTAPGMATVLGVEDLVRDARLNIDEAGA